MVTKQSIFSGIHIGAVSPPYLRSARRCSDFRESGSARLFKCVALNIKVLLIFKEGAGNVSLGSQTLVTCNEHVFHCTSKLHKLSEPTGTD